MFNSIRNILERFRWNVLILHISMTFQNVISDEETFFFYSFRFRNFYLTPKNVTVIFPSEIDEF